MRPEEYVIGLERSEHQRGVLEQNEEEFEEGDARPYDEQVAEHRIADRAHHDDVLAAVQAIFEDRPLEFDELELSVQEHSALEALRSAQSGKNARYNTFVYAEERRELLEQALAALQPILALDVSTSRELRENYEQLVARVTELREHLVDLEDAQDDEMVHHEVEEKAEEEGDDDKGDDEDDGDRPSSLFDGPEAPPLAARPSSLSSGPEAPPLAARPSSLSSGPEAPERAPAPSSLGDAAPAGGAAGRGGVLSRIGRALGLGGKSDDGGKGSS